MRETQTQFEGGLSKVQIMVQIWPLLGFIKCYWNVTISSLGLLRAAFLLWWLGWDAITKTVCGP